jgi:hypothetical protein
MVFFGGVGRKPLFLAMKDLGTWELSGHERIGKEAAFDQMFCEWTLCFFLQPRL